jgi:hypothetical protein
MQNRSYWLDLFTWTTWQEFLKAGGTVSGFRASRWGTTQKIKVGDYLICYLIGVSRFIGLLEVVKPPFQSNDSIWKDDPYPSRVGVKILVELKPETAVPIIELRALSCFVEGKGSAYWTGFVRSSPARWKPEDGSVVVQAIRSAEQNPVVRPFDARKLVKPPQALKSKLGPVTIPEPEPDTEPAESGLAAGGPAEEKQHTAHLEIQWLLAKLGNDMGLDVWVARNDQGKSFNGQRFAALKHLRSELSFNFDAAVNKTIEMIDVIWLKGNSILAAFEIESTTSIYSGLLRMADLISMLPNLDIPLFIVAPDERRQKVFTEVQRPTFRHLPTSMAEVCRFLAFSTLREQVAKAAPFIPHMKPDVLEDWAEYCEAEEV